MLWLNSLGCMWGRTELSGASSSVSGKSAKKKPNDPLSSQADQPSSLVFPPAPSHPRFPEGSQAPPLHPGDFVTVPREWLNVDRGLTVPLL